MEPLYYNDGRKLFALCGNYNASGGCGEVTEHNKMSGRMFRCSQCNYEHPINNEEIMSLLKEIDISMSNIRGRMIMLQEKDAELRRYLAFVPAPVGVESWRRSEVELHCYKCNRVTRWVHHGRAECHDGCAPGKLERKVSKRKISGDDLPADIIALLLGGDNIVDQDDATLEVIKATGRKVE